MWNIVHIERNVAMQNFENPFKSEETAIGEEKKWGFFFSGKTTHHQTKNHNRHTTTTDLLSKDTQTDRITGDTQLCSGLLSMVTLQLCQQSGAETPTPRRQKRKTQTKVLCLQTLKF